MRSRRSVTTRRGSCWTPSRGRGSDDPDAVRTALAATRGFKGVTGTIAYAAGSRIPSKSVTILQIDLGTRRFVEQLVPAVVPPP